MTSVLAGLAAGALLGAVLQRSGLCSRAQITAALDGQYGLARIWLVGVLLAAVGLSVLYLLPVGDGLNEGLAFRPVANVLGGLIIGIGMVIASTCVSGLFFKLGSGMLGAVVGLLGWAGGELAVRHLDIPGPTVLRGGAGATIPGLLGLPRLVVALVLLGVVLVLVRRVGVPLPGLALGLAITVAWLLAALGDSSFGPSSVGAVTSLADPPANRWLISFLLGLVLGGLLASARSGEFRARGETPRRYAGLLVGGALLGAGGWIAGGCTLGHGLSGTAQLNVSSVVVVAAIVAGVALARRVGPDRAA